MKRLGIISGISLFFVLLTGCYVDPDYYPYVNACFSTKYNSYWVGEYVDFQNCSEHADSYEWDFGNGEFSTEFEPSVSFSKPGNVTVKLVAYRGNAKDISYLTLKINVTTTLNILVMYKGTTDIVSNCEVGLYKTETDWVNLTNRYLSGNTDNDGIIEFYNLNTVRYYVDAYKKAGQNGYYSNEKLAFVTDVLARDKINYFDVYIEYFINKKGQRVANIVEIARSSPEQRKLLLKLKK